MIILEKGERADPLWGMDTEIITDEMIEALEQGKRLYLSVNDEYAVVIKKGGKRKTDKPEATDTDTISRQAAIDLIERYCDNGCEIAEDKWCPDCQQSKFAEMIKELPPSASRPKVIHCKDCKHWHKQNDLTYCDRIDYGYGYKPDDFCSYAELQ